MGVFDDDAAAADGDVRARLNLRYGIDVQPDAAARDRALARRYGLPQGLVQTYRPDYEAQARMDDAAPVLSQSPKLRDWLAADAGRAEVAHDDLPQLSAVEQAIRILKGSGGALLSGVNKFNEGAWGVARAGAELLPDVIGRPMAETFAEYGRTERGRAAALMPQADGNLSAGWYSGLQSLGLNLVQLPAVLATGGGAGALGMMGAVTGGQSYAQARDHGVGKAESLLFGTSQGVIEAGTEKLSIGPLMKLLQPGKFGAKALEYMLKEQGGEQIATALQDLNEWAVLPENQGKTFGDYMDARPDAIIQTAIATAVGGGGQVALMKGLAAITQRMGGDQERAQQAEQRAELMGQLGELAAASKVLQRDADTFQEFVAQAAGEDGPATDVYIDAQVLQQSGMAEQLAQVSPAVAEQFQAALQTGGDVRIPLAEYATRVAGTPLNQGLLDHLRLQPDDYSRADAKVFMQQHGEQLQADVARVIEQHSADADWQAGRDAVRADFARQLDEVGRWHADANRQYAALLGDYYAATAARAGMTPQELAARYPLRIQAKAGQGATLEQPGPGLDAVRQQWSGAGIKHAVHEKNGIITLSQIVVPEGWREAGAGTRAMQALVDYADRTGQHIALTPSGDFGGNKKRLVQFYKRFGFVENKGRNRAFTTSEGMYRQAPGKVLEQFAGANAATAVAQPARGQIAFGQDITQTPSVISLFDGADWSTLIHESGHFFLEAHMDLAGRIAGRIAEGEQVSDGERGIVADANALLGWFGVKGDEQAGGAAGGSLDQPVFHGTPHRGIDRFSTDKIGTGEGAQAYGWGLYFAGKREIAEWYREKLATPVLTLGGRPVSEVEAQLSPPAQQWLRWAQNKLSAMTVEARRAEVRRLQGVLEHGTPFKPGRAAFADEIGKLDYENPGQLYAVEIPEDSEMLLWDRPLSEQPEVVAKSAKALRMDLSRDWLEDELDRLNVEWDELTGKDLYNLVQKALVDDALVPNSGSDAEDAQINGATDKAASLLLADDGIKGIKYLDGTSRGAGDGSYNYVIFSGDDTQITNTFYQGGEQPDNRPEPPLVGRTPLDTWALMSIDQKRAYHEQFARGFERYALDGKAPSLSLQSVFQRFGAWLKNVYRSITQRSADDVLQVRLTDEVRQVMDRMIATDEQIREAEAVREMGPLFGTAEQAGMAPDDWTRYHELAAQATAQATERLQARSLKDMQWLRNARSRELKRMQARAAGLRREVQIEARREVLQRPVYRAWQFLTTKGDAAATAQPTPRVKASGALDNSMDNLFTAIAKLGGLRREDVAKAWGVDPKDRLESGVFGAPVLRKEGGLSIDAMAERLVEEGYLLPGEDGKADVADLEAAFDSQRRGVDQFSTWHDYAERAKAANGGDVPEALPEEIAHGKLDTNALRDMYGTGPDALWRTLSTRRMTSEANGIHPDVVAETFGFSSGDELARALAEAEPPRQAIDALTDQWMMERYADLATPDALERAVDDALHNEARTRMVAAELQALQDAANPRGAAELDKRGRTQSLLPKAARDVAQVMISRLKIRDLRPLQYTAAEGRAARAAAKSLQAGDMAQAAAHKRSQLLQAAAARAAMDARDEADRARAYLKRMADGPKGLPADYRDQINALLERHDLRARSDKDNDRRASMSAWMLSQLSIGNIPQFSESLLSPEEARSYRADLQQRDESGNLIYEDEGKAAERLAAGIERSRAVPWRDLTVEQMRGLVDAVKQIEHLGRLKGKLLAKRDAASFDAARDAIVAGIVQYGGEAKPLPARRTRNDALGKAWQAVVAFGASHIKVSTWARRMDGGTDNGAVWRHFVRPANEAASRESTMRAEATAGLMEILQPVLKRVPMTEMSGRGRHFPTIGDSLNWQERFALALNTGNEGNLQRLLDGHGWTRQQIDPVLQSLTVDEWVAVQQVWDFFERYRPQIGELEKRTAGREPEWVQPMPQRVRASSGQMVDLRGGYYPIKYDPRQSARAESHQGAEEAKAMMRAANLAASTRRSFVKQRAEEVKGRPLLLNMQGLYGGVNDVIHDLCWREWLMDTGKLLRSDAVQEAIRAHWGAHVTHEFRRWTEDIAAGSRRLDHGVEKAVSFVRQNVSLASLGFNVLNAAQQITGYANSVARVGAVPMARALAGMAGSPRRMTREAMAASEFLRNRTRTRFRELNELRNQVEGQTTAREMIGRYGYWMSMRMQLLVDVSTWWAAHDAAIAAGHDEAAVALADQAVKDAQGGGEEVDQAGIERGGPLVKLFSTFYSYMGATLNTAVLAGTAPGSHAKRAANVLLVLSVPAMLGMLVKDLLTPGGDDDEDPEKLARRLAAEQLSFLFGMVVVGREAQFLGKQIMGENAFGYSGPSGLRFFSDLQKLGGQTMQGEFDEAWLKSFVSVTGDLTGLPSTQVNRIISGAYAIERGDVSGPVETVAAPVFGFQRQN